VGDSVDTGGQALLQEDRQLFLLSFDEGSDPEPLVQDRESHDLGVHPGVGSDLADSGALVVLIREASSGRLEDGRAGRGGIPPALSDASGLGALTWFDS
jgi:hypothetical protein